MPETYPPTGLNRHPDKNISITNTHNNSIKQEFGGGYERRIIRTRRTKRKYTLRYTKIQASVKDTIQSFYKRVNGDYESFLLDLTHIHETGTVLVRFDGPLNMTLIDTLDGTNYYDVNFTLLEVYT